MSDLHPVERLFEQLKTFGQYPPGVVPMAGRLTGTEFFPGGAGLWNTHPGAPLPPMPVGGVMVLGHYFDCETGFANALARHRADHINGQTWRNLRKLFGRVSLPMERCFFTNAYVGLKTGSNPTGLFPGADDPDFVCRCRAFLLEQIRMQQPTLILTLGKEVPPVIAPLTPELAAQWPGVDSLGALDERGAALVFPATFPSVEHSVAVLALTHPALRHLNVGRRHFDGMTGDAAEVALLQKALTRISTLGS